MKYRFIGMEHPDELADGRLLAYGDQIDLSKDEQAANQRLIDDGLLLSISSTDDGSKPKKRRQESDK